MPRLPVVSGKALLSALKKAGFIEVRQRGSHISLEKITPEKIYRTVVPMHPELSKGTLIDILRQTGLSKDDLINLL
jgi:predicted RNA binding protein YcfA (HicA-like mRNA interferase family)